MLRFKVKLDGEQGSSVASMTPPFDIIETFGTKARVPVRGTINGFPFRSSLMPMGGCHFMVVNKTIREGAKVKAGDVVDVAMQRDEAERTVEAPPELEKEMKKSKVARERWEKLSFTHKKEMALCIRDAKQEETKKRRLEKVMNVLKTGAKWTG
jgi:ribosomal 50S subunit-recycling heat shock protein